MADYTDNNNIKLLESVIDELINEEISGTAPVERTMPGSLTSENLPVTKLMNLLKFLFTPKGFASLGLLGLVYDKEFTLATVDFAIDLAKSATDPDILSAVQNQTSLTDKVKSFFKVASDSATKDIFDYIDELEAIKPKSMSATIVSRLVDKYRLLGLDSNNEISISEEEGSLYDSLVKGEGLGAFIEFDKFYYDKSDNTFNYHSTSNRDLWLNRRIIDKINNRDYDGAARTYDAAFKIQKAVNEDGENIFDNNNLLDFSREVTMDNILNKFESWVANKSGSIKNLFNSKQAPE